MKTLVVAIIVILVLLGGWYFVSSVLERPQPPSTPPAGNETASTTFPPGTSMETGTVETATTTEDDFTVNGFNFGYSPSSLTVKKGDHVRITFVNTGGLHDFHIDEFNVATPRIGTDASTTVEFDATKAGTFQYYCSVGNHRAMGMWGTLTVVE